MWISYIYCGEAKEDDSMSRVSASEKIISKCCITQTKINDKLLY